MLETWAGAGDRGVLEDSEVATGAGAEARGVFEDTEVEVVVGSGMFRSQRGRVWEIFGALDAEPRGMPINGHQSLQGVEGK